MNYTIWGTVGLVGFFLWILSVLGQVRSDIARINTNLNKIMKHIGINDEIDNELKELILEGKKIEAIKK